MPRLRHFGTHLLISKFELTDALRYAQLLESQGYDMIQVGDHTLIPGAASPYPNAHTVLTAMGVLTKKIKLATAVTDPFRRHPVEIAHALATLDQLTNGRAMLGIGAGEMMNLAPFGIDWTKPFTRVKEAIQVIRMLWRATPSNPVTYEGNAFRLHDAYLQTRPSQKILPIYVGALSQRLRELTGEVGDGYIPIAVESPSSLRVHLQDVERGAQRAGRTLDDIDVAVTIYTDVSDNEESAYNNVRSAARAGLIQDRGILKMLTGIEIPREFAVQTMSATDGRVRRQLEELALTVPREAIEQVTAFGSVDRCAHRIEEYLESGATSIVICNVSDNPGKVFEAYAKEIMPMLRERFRD